MNFFLLILFILFSPFTLADIGENWELAGYFCRSSTGQLNKISTGKLDLDLTLNFNTNDNTYSFEAIWNYGSMWDSFTGDTIYCKVTQTGMYIVDDSTLDFYFETTTVEMSEGTCPPSNLGIGGSELQLDFFEKAGFIYFSTGIKCKLKEKSADSTALELGLLYQGVRRSQDPSFGIMAIP